MATTATEDYLKQIFLLELKAGGDSLVSMGQLATTMNVAPGTATSMVKRLAEAGLIAYEPYGGVRLTTDGRSHATAILRRHRLIETFLVEVLGLDWAEVHDEAEDLEHAVSDRLLERIDAFLNFPAVDPHGDPIPTQEGRLRQGTGRSLTDCSTGDRVRIVRVIDQRQTFLQFVDRCGLRPGTRIEILNMDPVADAVSIRPEQGEVATLGRLAAAKLLVERTD